MIVLHFLRKEGRLRTSYFWCSWNKKKKRSRVNMDSILVSYSVFLRTWLDVWTWRRINVSKCIIAQLIRYVEAIRAAVVSDPTFISELNWTGLNWVREHFMPYIYYSFFRFYLTHSKFPGQVLTECEIINTVLWVLFKRNEKRYVEDVPYIEIVACFIGSWWRRY